MQSKQVSRFYRPKPSRYRPTQFIGKMARNFIYKKSIKIVKYNTDLCLEMPTQISQSRIALLEGREREDSGKCMSQISSWNRA